MTLGWYCGDDPFGPWDSSHRDLTRCFQSLILLLPPALFMLLAFAYRMSRIRHIPASSLLLDPLPRFPQIISASLCLLSLIYLGYFLLSMGGALAPFMVLSPSLSFVAWIASLLLLRFEHSRHIPSTPPINRIFYLLSFLSAAKLAESSVMNCLYSPQLTAYDVLVFLNLFLSCFMLRYAVTGVVARGGRLTLWDDLEDGLGSSTSIQQEQQGEDDAAGQAATPTRRDKGMWKRFLAFSTNGSSDAGGGGYSDDVGSLKSPGRGASVFSSLDARDDSSTNPFAAESRDVPAAATNPFASSVSPPPPAAASSSSSSSSLSSKIKSLTASLLETHPLSGASISLPSYQDATIAGRSVVQYQLLLRLTLPSITSGDADVDALTTWKRYREFEGLHAAITATAGEYSLQPPPLPPAPRKGKREEGRAALESYLEDAMAQPLYWEDVGDWVGVREKVEYIAGWKAEQLREAERRRREQEEERLAAIDAADKLKKQKQGQGKGAATGAAGVNGSSMQIVKVAVERPAGLSYKYQIIAVSVRGWSKWLDDVTDGGEAEEEEKGRTGQRVSRSALSSPALTPAAAARGRKAGSANPSLSSSSFYLTVDLPVKTTVGDYTVYKTLQEVTDFRAELGRFLTSNTATAHLANSLPPLSVPRSPPDASDVAGLLKAANGAEIFFQALVSTSAFQCNALYAFLARRGREETDEGGERKRRHLVSGQKPIASFLVADGDWRDAEAVSAASTAASSKATSPAVSVPGSPALRGEETAAKRKRKTAPTGRGAAAVVTEKKDFANAPLFPEADAAISSSHSLPGSGPPSPSMLPSSLTHAPSPLRQHSSDPSDASDSHRFSVSIPSFSPAEPDNPSSHILFVITVREYFSLSSFIEWTVTRRYRDFDSLHAALSRQFPSYPLPLLPSKKRKVGRRSDAELQSRRSQLELFLQQIINVRVFQVDEFFAFFDLQNANRVFSVGTQLQQRDSTAGLDRVHETEPPARMPPPPAVVKGDGRNGGGAGGGARQRARGADAHRHQPSEGAGTSTNPFG